MLIAVGITIGLFIEVPSTKTPVDEIRVLAAKIDKAGYHIEASLLYGITASIAGCRQYELSEHCFPFYVEMKSQMERAKRVLNSRIEEGECYE